ncbi:hypothetical protein D9M72_648050 [compost metagenome]
MHAQPQAEAEGRIVLAVQRVGEHPQFLGVGDQLVRRLQVGLGDATALQQPRARNAGVAEHLGGQRHGVQGGQGALFGKLGCCGHLDFSCRNSAMFRALI